MKYVLLLGTHYHRKFIIELGLYAAGGHTTTSKPYGDSLTTNTRFMKTIFAELLVESQLGKI